MACTLKFCPLQSCVDVSFWSELGSRKLDEYKLSETPIGITGFLTASRHVEISSLFQVLRASFDTAGTVGSQQNCHVFPGELVLTNTLESFKRVDKFSALQSSGSAVWEAITTGAAEQQPALLSKFLLLAYGDLKHFVFHYWFAFPALKPPSPFQQLSVTPLVNACPHSSKQICTAADQWRSNAGEQDSSSSSSHHPDMYCLMRVDDNSHAVQTAPLSAWLQFSSTGEAAAAVGDTQQQQKQQVPPQDVLLVMFDPCHLPLTPGWPLRNVLLLAAVRWRMRRLRVLCVRDSSGGRASADRSFVIEVELPEILSDWLPGAAPQATGWEADVKGKLLPRRVDVSGVLSPVQLSDQAVDLNLRLMRWRAAPGLDVNTLAQTKCLLLGAGTLGCAVSRVLQAYGVRHITFVDSSTVSYSNPVRQSLFKFQDCLDGGRPKAAAAAEALREIFPSVVSAGVGLSIPMPGHPPANTQQEQLQQQAAEQLHDLVERHDVVFLLTDTRESRWLPTLLAAAAGKLAITAALGFDNFVVMRHGLPSQQTAAAAAAGGCPASRQLGCYFCNDVVAPLNSTIDRTLDEQCTVARPGLAPIAAALSVELMAAVLQHPMKGHAPAQGTADSTNSSSSSSVGALGPVPHMIRGQLSGFSQVCMVGQAFSQCTACSAAVVERYRRDGWGFVCEVLSQPSLLEEMTGLADLHRQAAALRLEDDSDEEGDSQQQQQQQGVREGDGSEGDWTEL